MIKVKVSDGSVIEFDEKKLYFKRVRTIDSEFYTELAYSFFIVDYMANEEKKTILKRQKEAYESLPRDEKGRIVSRKKNKPVGRENAFDNMTTKQRKTIDLWIEKRITTDECIKITKFSRSTIFRIKKILKSENS